MWYTNPLPVLVLLIGSSGISVDAMALPFVQGRASGGYVYASPDGGGKGASTGTISATGRFGYQFDNSNYFVAIDINAYRIYRASSIANNNDGNSALFAFGHDWPWLSLWLAGGAGEIRSRDRGAGDDRISRYYATDAQLGMTTSLYTSDEARVEIGATLGRITPDPEWRARYGLNAIHSLQFDIGFKLANW